MFTTSWVLKWATQQARCFLNDQTISWPNAARGDPSKTGSQFWCGGITHGHNQWKLTDRIYFFQSYSQQSIFTIWGYLLYIYMYQHYKTWILSVGLSIWSPYGPVLKLAFWLSTLISAIWGPMFMEICLCAYFLGC